MYLQKKTATDISSTAFVGEKEKKKRNKAQKRNEEKKPICTYTLMHILYLSKNKVVPMCNIHIG